LTNPPKDSGKAPVSLPSAGDDSARLAAIVAGAEDAIVSKTLEGIITSWNPGAEALFGYTADEAIGRSIAFIIPPDRLHEETEILARVRRGERTEHFETRRLRKDGRLVEVSVNVSPVHDASGRVIGASKIARDISDKRRAQARLGTSLRSLESLYRLADRVGQARSRQDVCDAAIEAIQSAMGTSRASVLTFDVSGVMRFTCWAGLSERYRAAADGHSPWHRDTLNPRPILVEDVLTDPSVAALRDEIVHEGIRSLAFIPLQYQGRLLGKFMVYFEEPRVLTPEECRLAETIGQHVGFGLARVDAEAAAAEALERERTARTDADLARAHAEQVNRAKDEFLAMLAHELRNPLGVIMNAGSILRSHRALAPELATIVSMVERQSKHLARLLDDLLDVARITSGHIELERQRLDFRTTVTQAVEAQRLRLNAKDQRVSLSLPATPVPVIGDAVRLQQIVGNLVNNASKYTPPEGSIWVELAVQQGRLELKVRDTGAGIPAEQLDAIFDLFVQANPTLARTEGGLGVGLTLVRRLVELHEGRVEGRSEGLLKGSEFVVNLPLADAEEDVIAGHAPRPEVSPKRIVVIEDHADGREAVCTLLRLQGHEVFEAATGREGIALVGSSRPDVVLVDIGLPDLDGYAVGQTLLGMPGNRAHLIALTGYGQPTDRERATKAGFEAHLVKPVDERILRETLAIVVG